jgi:tetratricopeptide (TPR) repeat protein/tRNA A-37 threonylcarbamoyl transferase component Bud32
MNPEPASGYEQLTPDAAAGVDAVCDAFEKAWKTVPVGGAAPDPASYLDGYGGPGRSVLFRELAALDRACRERYAVPGRLPDDPGRSAAALITRSALPGAGGPCRPEGWPSIPGLELLSVIGSGGMGIVFKARQAALDRDVAVKLLRDASLGGSGQRERFLQEARVVARLQHPNLVQVHEFGEVPDPGETTARPYLVLEYVAGGNLADLVRGSPQPPPAAARLVESLAHAIHYAHQQGVIHRDLKPANILLQGSGIRDQGLGTRDRIPDPQSLIPDYLIPKITDFGLAKFLAGRHLTQTGEMLGTPSYMAPEQTVGKAGSITVAVDVYGLGAILYEVLTGRPPFQADTPLATLALVQHEEPVPPRRLQPTVPRDLQTICLKCLQKDPRRRYAAAAALADDLGRFLAGQPICARPVGHAERAWRWARRNPLAAGLLAVLAVVLVGSLVSLTALWLHAESQRQEADQQRRLAEDSYSLARESLAEFMKLRDDERLQEGDLEDLRRRLTRAEVNFYERFVAQRGTGQQFSIERAGALLALGQRTQDLGDESRARTHFEQAAAAFESVLADTPDLPLEIDQLGLCRYFLAELYRNQGRWKEAVAAYEQAITLWRRRDRSADAGQATRQHNLALAYAGLGNLHRRTQQIHAAQKALNRACQLFQDLSEKHPGVPDYPFGMAMAHNDLGLLYQAAGRLRQALSVQQLASGVLERLVHDHSGFPLYRVTLARHLHNLALLYRPLDLPHKALAAEDRALALLEPLARQRPQFVLYQLDLARSHNTRGLALEALGRPRDSTAAFHRALALADRLARQEPTSAPYALLRGGTRCNLGNLMHQAKQFPAALEWFDQARSILEEIYRRQPRNTEARAYLGTCLEGRARTLAELGRYPEAAEEMQRGLDLKPETERPVLRLECGGWQARAGDCARATAEAEEILRGKDVAPLLIYNAACVYALAAARTTSPRGEGYALRAIALLRRARTRGFFQAHDRQTLLETDRDLDALRRRADFRKLLKH